MRLSKSEEKTNIILVKAWDAGMSEKDFLWTFHLRLRQGTSIAIVVRGVGELRISRLVLLSVLALCSVSHAQLDQITVNGRIIEIEGRCQSPTPAERALAAPYASELKVWRERAKTASGPLRTIRELDKKAEESTGPERERWLVELEQARNSTDFQYQAYLEADRALTAAIGRTLQGMSQRDRLLNPLMNSYVHVVPYIAERENTIPKDISALDDYRAKYESTRSEQTTGPASFMRWQGGQDPTFEEYNNLLALVEQQNGYIPGFFHAIAWRESMGNVQEGAMNADERGLFQIQTTDYQPDFGVPLNEPAGSLWGQFDQYCRWVPFNLAVKFHGSKRLVEQAEEYGFSGDDRFHLAYRFYNESSGYILFSRERLKIYRDLFGLSSAELHENDIDVLNRFIYFQKDELLQMYDWAMPDGRIAGEALWEAWRNARIEVTSDLIWKVLLRRLIEDKQYFTLSIDEQGRRWCVTDLTMQNIKRRGSPMIPGLSMAAIGICSARGVVPTARIFEAYFYNNLGAPAGDIAALAPIPNQPAARVPDEALLVQRGGTAPVSAYVQPMEPAPAAVPVESIVPATETPSPQTPTPLPAIPLDGAQGSVGSPPVFGAAPQTPAPITTSIAATPLSSQVTPHPLIAASQPAFLPAPAATPPVDAPVEAMPVN